MEVAEGNGEDSPNPIENQQQQAPNSERWAQQTKQETILEFNTSEQDLENRSSPWGLDGYLSVY
jgi:hypothetical protein